MRILLTGPSGFVGSALLPALLREGHEVHLLSRYVTGRYSLDNNTINHYASLTDYAAVRRIVRQVQPDIVINLAAISPVSYSYDRSIEVAEVNYLGVANLADACLELPNFTQFIQAGTSEIYGSALRTADAKISEEFPYLPTSPYAVAKAAAVEYIRYMGRAYTFPYTILMPFNTYGRKNNTHFFIERTITQMLLHSKVILGDPDAIRDWLYIDDHIDGYLKAIGNKRAIGETINLATGVGYTTRATAEHIAELTDFKGEILWHSTPQRPLDAKILIGDNQKAQYILGWKPTHTLEQGLTKTISWWKNAGKQ